MKQPQRYTGPELGALLREVRAELGDHATIHEANRIREGGVAGFFRREAFEVLASNAPGTGTAVVSWDTPANDWLDSDDTRIEPSITAPSLRRIRKRAKRNVDTIEPDQTLTADDELVAKLTAAMESEQAWAESIGTTEMAPPPAVRMPPRRFGPQDLAPLPDEPTPSPATALLEAPRPLPHGDADRSIRANGASGHRLLERADSVSTQDRVGQLLAGAQELINDRSLARRTLVDDRTVDRLGVGDTINSESTGGGDLTDSEVCVASTPSDSTMTRIAPIRELEAPTPPPSITRSAAAEHRAAPGTASRIRTGDAISAPRRSEAFWTELTELEGFLPVRPTSCANVQLLVGPLDVAMPLASRFAVDRAVELHVLSDEVELVGIEPRQMAETSRDLGSRLAGRESRAVGVIEADDSRRGEGEPLDRMLPPRLLTLIDRVCIDGGVDLVRLTLHSLGPVDKAAALVKWFSVPCAIDLAMAPEPAQLDAALDARLPIVSVAGRQLTPALAMALKQR